MKFITEMELRELYKREPFTTFALEPNTRITPGARQFLVDKRVTLVQAQQKQTAAKKNKAGREKPVTGSTNWCTEKLRRKMDYVESLLLLVGLEIWRAGDAGLAEEVMALLKYFRSVRNAEKEQKAPDTVQFWGWTEDEIKKRADDMEKHVDINESHYRLANGKEIILLNHVRAALREVEPALLEVYWDDDKQICVRQDLIDKVNLIINILCMIMWKRLGGNHGKD
ncbi:hypothetical protein [Desulforamulus hydrothermalis]|uniref:Cobalamin adenosyltransferase-like domain-containing protein n=1 Tax=Desulforamulus hydrothermalis Lam5 = DSM 18033 TaxID=1121428 RepID=K8EGC2_9FIRM|nr:hypothetical protein [Desulforamulus hydrothermalis]CCO07721.1 conserved hypothetical protein [Desulforamulus hydrothermalis Lam5 = DSM 18033]SHH33764.1 Ethanolamine utilization cobalamin adenosyltransferase [Desulforamulus hydrothermalis Lam5 = DSM 18033]